MIERWLQNGMLKFPVSKRSNNTIALRGRKEPRMKLTKARIRPRRLPLLVRLKPKNPNVKPNASS